MKHKTAIAIQIRTISWVVHNNAIWNPTDVGRSPRIHDCSQAPHRTTRKPKETRLAGCLPSGPRDERIQKCRIWQMPEQHVIEPAQTDWATSIVFTHERDKIFCFCVDFRKLVLSEKRNSDTFSRMNECIDSLGIAAIFSNSEINGGYFQIEI